MAPVRTTTTQNKRLRLSKSVAAAPPPQPANVAATSRNHGTGLQHAGLRNLGNTCYLNAVLQVLLRCPLLHGLLRQHADAASTADSVLAELRSTFETMATEPSTHSPSRLLERLRAVHYVFRSGGQHDAQELLRCLLISVHEAWAAPPSQAAPSAVERVFHGQLEYTTRCLQCDGRRTRHEGFSDLSLTVDQTRWGLDDFFEAERLRGDDKYYCDSCRAFTEAVRTPRVRRAGPVLSLHLKRFARDGGEDEARRVGQHVQLPASLTLGEHATPCCSRRATPYELFALVAHSGRSGCGHYVSYVRPCGEASQLDAALLRAALPAGAFLRFDDEECAPVTADELAGTFAPGSRSAGLACICFYRATGE